MTEPTYQIWNEDCITGMAERVEPESVDLTVTSIPFGALFQYSGKTEDVGNNLDGVDLEGSHFGLHLRFFIEQLYRVHRPGTVACIHIQQLLATKVQHGYMGRREFRGAVINMFVASGWQSHGEVVIPKNPQAIAQRQKLHSLLFVTGKRDSRALAPAVNDLVLMFRKPGDGTPVRALYDPKTNPDGWLTTEEWIRDAHGVWTDIREMDVLTGWQHARESDQEKHVCPLQLEVIRRCVRLYSNPGATVLDPYAGIGSTQYVALEQGRNAVGFELKESYHQQALDNCERALNERDIDQMPLFAEIEVAG